MTKSKNRTPQPGQTGQGVVTESLRAKEITHVTKT